MQLPKKIIMRAIKELCYRSPLKRYHYSTSTCMLSIISDIHSILFYQLMKELETISYDKGFHLMEMDNEEIPKKKVALRYEREQYL